MQPAGTVEEFLSSPAGRWVAAGNFLAWTWSPRLSGAAVWDRPGEEDVERFFSLLQRYRADSIPRDVVVDVSRVSSVDASTFAALLERSRDLLPRFAGCVRHLAMIRGDGLLGAVAEGFVSILGPRTQWRTFRSALPAFRWAAPIGAAAVALEVERMVENARGLDPTRRCLRDYLCAHLAGATLPKAAKALGVSERTLHRLLRGADTGFRDELRTARVEAARTLLTESRLKIADIAARVGCSSHAHLTRLFRRATRESPAEYRARMGAKRVKVQRG